MCKNFRKSKRNMCMSWRNRYFIRPPYNFKHVDAIVTNFHLPKSSLLMMMSAFTGYDLLMKAYEEAIKQNIVFIAMVIAC